MKSPPPVRCANMREHPPGEEIRVQRGDCVISIWLPASAEAAGEALSALGRLGFNWYKIPEPEGETDGDQHRTPT